MVTGEVNPAALDELVRLCVQLGELRRHHGAAGGRGQGAPAPDTTRAWEALEQAVIGQAVDLVSAPGGLASFLRRRQLGARLGGPSLPLDVGVSTDIPAAIRRAVILRDQHCRFPGGCDQPAAACEVHHLTRKADGGKTSINDCALFCTFHHQVIIHQQGWTVVLNPDGTTTAWNKDKTKILRSHSPPVRPGVTPRGAQRRRFRRSIGLNTIGPRSAVGGRKRIARQRYHRQDQSAEPRQLRHAVVTV